MYLSHALIKNAFTGLKKIDDTAVKSRQWKVTGLKYLLATSQLLKEDATTNIDLTVGSEARQRFIAGVGNVVALNDKGLYSNDFDQDFSISNDYKTGNNFLTTRLANSRNQDIRYPGRPAPLLFLSNEHISILEDVADTLSKKYGLDAIKPELSLWLLRNENFETANNSITSSDLIAIIKDKLASKYTSEITKLITPSESELETFTKTISEEYFSAEKPNYEDIAVVLEAKPAKALPIDALILSNDLPDKDEVFTIVQQLLSRGAKGILFSGPPGTSKTWYALKIAIKIIDGDENRLERVQFHPSFSYEDFIEGLVSTGSIAGNEPLFKPKDKVFLNLCNKARQDKDNLYIMVIDEFSRGDPSKIFGELLTYIEPDYREIEFRLPYSENETSIPQNVVIFATMNPYDKSVVDLDSAMERRFDMIELPPKVTILKELLGVSGVESEVLGKVIAFFNAANRLSPHGFGHTYFKGLKEEHDFILLWNHKLKFTLKKMFHFQDDAYNEVRQAYVDIISDGNKDKIA